MLQGRRRTQQALDWDQIFRDRWAGWVKARHLLLIAALQAGARARAGDIVDVDVVLEHEVVTDKMAELQDEIAQLDEAIESLRRTRDIHTSWRDQRWQVLGFVEKALHRGGVLKDQAIAGYEDDVGRAETALRELATRKKALEGRRGHCERPAEAPAQREEPAAARVVIARTEEAGTGSDDIPETPRDPDEHTGEDALLPGMQSGASPKSAPAADDPGEAGSGCGAPEAPFTPDTAAPIPVPGGAIAISDPVPATARQAAPPPHRRGRAVAVLTAAGLVVLSAAGFVATQGTVLSGLTASLFGNGSSRTGGRPEAAAQSRVAAIPLPAAPAKPKSLPVAYDRQAQTPGPSAAPVAPPLKQKYEAPRSATSAPGVLLRAAPVRTAPSTPIREGRSLVDRSLVKSLRQAGDVKIQEGDIASARLFYERAADAGDARAALYLGNSFNPAFLERLGVLGMHGDVVMAAQWYRRALVLGSPEAGKALRTLPR